MELNWPPARESPPRMLVIFPGALGDLLCLAPVLSALARRHRGAGLELMARAELGRFAEARLEVARSHSIDRREVALLFREAGGGERARAFFSAFERVYCFFGAGEPRFKRALEEAATPGQVTFHRFRPDGRGHVAAGYLKEIGARAPRPIRASLSPRAGDFEAAARALDGVAAPGRFIVIFPGSGSPSKNWPVERFIALARTLHGGPRAVFVLGPAEAGLRAPLRAARIPALENLSLGTVAAVARQARAFVGVDSGAAHLAAAAGCPGVVLFGPTAPERWRPLGAVRVIRREPLEAIEPGEVMRALNELTGCRG